MTAAAVAAAPQTIPGSWCSSWMTQQLPLVVMVLMVLRLAVVRLVVMLPHQLLLLLLPAAVVLQQQQECQQQRQQVGQGRVAVQQQKQHQQAAPAGPLRPQVGYVQYHLAGGVAAPQLMRSGLRCTPAPSQDQAQRRG